MDRDQVVGMLVECLDRRTAGAARLQAIYLHGSVAMGRERPDSDVDLALLVVPPLDANTVHELAQDLARAIGRDVDLADLRRSSTVFAMLVTTRGERLLTPDAAAADRFTAETLADYADLCERRRSVVERFEERYRAG